jgi:hypothetical protein
MCEEHAFCDVAISLRYRSGTMTGEIAASSREEHPLLLAMTHSAIFYGQPFPPAAVGISNVNIYRQLQ